MQIVSKNSGCQAAKCNNRDTRVVEVRLNVRSMGSEYPAFYSLCQVHETEMKSLKSMKTRGYAGTFLAEVMSVKA